MPSHTPMLEPMTIGSTVTPREMEISRADIAYHLKNLKAINAKLMSLATDAFHIAENLGAAIERVEEESRFLAAVAMTSPIVDGPQECPRCGQRLLIEADKAAGCCAHCRFDAAHLVPAPAPAHAEPTDEEIRQAAFRQAVADEFGRDLPDHAVEKAMAALDANLAARN